MRSGIYKFCIVLFWCFGINAEAQTKKSAPNIILFLVDDMGWQDTSVPFYKTATDKNHLYHTPNMEKLASRGVKFTNAYATPVCTPTRVSLMSGMNAARHRVTNWTSVNKDENSDNSDSLFHSVDWNINGLSPIPNVPKTVFATPLPQLLKNAGYFTIHCGKAHFASAGTPGANPINIGFDVNIGGTSAGQPGSYLSENEYGNILLNGKKSIRAVPGLDEFYGTHTFLTEALTQKTITVLDSVKEKSSPFFLYMAQYAVHLPYEADDRFLAKYEAMGLSKNEAAYATLIEGMDKSLGDLMNWLDQNKLTDNTIIIFMSDNGGLSQVPPRSGVANTQNAPLNVGKGSVYEGGTRVPMIVSWPNKIKPNSITESPIIIEDFFPTILELAQVKKYITVQEIDGKSFVSQLRNTTVNPPKRTFIWHYPNKWIPQAGPGISWFSAIRVGDWKLIYDYSKQKSSLYNLRLDIGETNDLALANERKKLELAKLLTTYLKKYSAQLPVYKKTNKVVLWPDQTK